MMRTHSDCCLRKDSVQTRSLQTCCCSRWVDFDPAEKETVTKLLPVQSNLTISPDPHHDAVFGDSSYRTNHKNYILQPRK